MTDRLWLDSIEAVVSDDMKRVAVMRRFERASDSRTRYFIDSEGFPAARHENIVASSLRFSPNGMKLAYIRQGAGKAYVVENGAEEGPYDEVQEEPGLLYSSDSSKLAYVARSGQEWLAVVQRERYPYERIVPGTLGFNRDGREIGFVAARGAKSFAVVNGVAGPEFDRVELGRPMFHPTSGEISYSARRGQQWVLMLGVQDVGLDGQEISGPVHSPDGKRMAIVTRTGETQSVSVDGVAGEPYTRVDWKSVTFGPGSGRIGYLAYRQDKLVVVVDSVETRSLESAPSGILFSPNGKRVAFIGRRGGQNLLFVDGKDMAVAGLLSFPPVFSDDSRRLAYLQTNGTKKVRVRVSTSRGPNYRSDRKALVSLAVDGVTGSQYDAVAGSRLAFEGVDTVRAVAVSGERLVAVEERFIEMSRMQYVWNTIQRIDTFLLITGGVILVCLLVVAIEGMKALIRRMRVTLLQNGRHGA